MRTTIIPAQVTTVEDKIAGSLNMTQILILMIPVLWTALVYVVFLPAVKIAPYKIALVLISVAICGILALRIKDKIVAEWLGVVVKYQLRPKYWLYNKNSLAGRELDIPEIAAEPSIAKKIARATKQTNEAHLSVADLVRLENMLGSGKVAVRYQFTKKHI